MTLMDQLQGREVRLYRVRQPGDQEDPGTDEDTLVYADEHWLVLYNEAEGYRAYNTRHIAMIQPLGVAGIDPYDRNRLEL